MRSRHHPHRWLAPTLQFSLVRGSQGMALGRRCTTSRRAAARRRGGAQLPRSRRAVSTAASNPRPLTLNPKAGCMGDAAAGCGQAARAASRGGAAQRSVLAQHVLGSLLQGLPEQEVLSANAAHCNRIGLVALWLHVCCGCEPLLCSVGWTQPHYAAVSSHTLLCSAGSRYAHTVAMTIQ